MSEETNVKKYYNRAGQLHNDLYQPAVVYTDRSSPNEYWFNGEQYKVRFRYRYRFENNVEEKYDMQTCDMQGMLQSINDTPSTQLMNGSKFWHHYGNYHRDGDKPAYITDSVQKWYQKGFLHREGGKPAVVYTDKSKSDEYYINGLIRPPVVNGTKHTYDSNGILHSTNDIPSVENANGTKHWHKHGLKHREGDKPAVEYVDGVKEWFINGKYHREGDMPARETSTEMEWYQHGKRHREVGKPAIVYLDKSIDGKFYFEGEQYLIKNTDIAITIHDMDSRYHSVGDRPAIESSEMKAWYRHGQLHRDGDMPAVEFSNGTRYWYKNHMIHRDGDKAAVERINGEKLWYQNGKCHRDGDKPAIESTTKLLWYQNGKLHREVGKPAIVHMDKSVPDKYYFEDEEYLVEAKDGTQTTLDMDKQYHSFGYMPAIELPNGYKAWYNHGKLHRDNDQPAVIRADGNKCWYKDGVFHRDGNKPALEFGNNLFWYQNGKLHMYFFEGKHFYLKGETDTLAGMTVDKEGEYHSFDGKSAIDFQCKTELWFTKGNFERAKKCSDPECWCLGELNKYIKLDLSVESVVEKTTPWFEAAKNQFLEGAKVAEVNLSDDICNLLYAKCPAFRALCNERIKYPFYSEVKILPTGETVFVVMLNE